MHDYMKAMKQQFCQEAGGRHRHEVERLHRQLSQRLDRKNRRLLLHLMDEQEMRLEESSLAAFTSGFRSAVGLARELSQEKPYSFDKAGQRINPTCAASKIAPHKQRKDSERRSERR